MGFWSREWKAAGLLLGGFLATYCFPADWLASVSWVPGPVVEAVGLARWYAREHVLLCLVPAFFIAGAIGVFISQEAVMAYLGPAANRMLAYGVASVSGSILAVCSCTVLPLFAGIYKRGAGLGPAAAFLYAGPAINVLAIILTARVLGIEIGIARAAGAVTFSVVIGMIMTLLFRREERARARATQVQLAPTGGRPLWQNVLLFGSMVAILVFANWSNPQEAGGLIAAAYAAKWWLTALAAAGLVVVLTVWFGLPWRSLLLPGTVVVGTGAALPAHPAVPFTAGVVGLSAVSTTVGGELEEWFASSWGFAKQMLPLLLLGVLFAGLLLGRPGEAGLIPPAWITSAVGGNTFGANLFASAAGALMYFATLTEVPILEGLIRSGMGKGPALALLLAGPALSLPNMLVIRSVFGTKKTLAFVGLTVVMATVTGVIYGSVAT
jgi:uncharacterized membrane protein YraQ (UPF0718 family)